MQMTAKEQALLTIVLDEKVNSAGLTQTYQMWADLYDDVINAEVTDEDEDVDFDDIIGDFFSEFDCPDCQDVQEQFEADVAVVDAHMTALQGDDLEDDEKAMIAASFVNLMDNQTAEMIFQAIADRWSEEARQRFNEMSA
jgi:hypothetical protein